MTQVMKRIRAVDVAQFVFVPAAGAVMAESGADVIKVEHPVRGHAQRGMLTFGGANIDPVVNPMIEHPNCGKRSVWIDVATPEGRQLVLEMAKTADAFTTSDLPSMRQKLGIDIDDVRAVNTQIIYARGPGFGGKGPDRDRGGFDATAFWIHSGVAHARTPQESEVPFPRGIGAIGDSQSGMYFAGAVRSSALCHERCAASVRAHRGDPSGTRS